MEMQVSGKPELSEHLQSSESADELVVEKQTVTVESEPTPKEKVIRTLKSFHQFVNPPNTVNSSGSQKLIFLEFLRGFAIFIMLAGHEAETTFDQSEILQPTFNGIMSTIIGAPFGLFGGYRTFFILISGAAHAYSFFLRCFEKQPREVIIYQALALLGSIIVLPLYFAWHIINSVGYGFQWGSMTLDYPLWKSAASYCHAVIFFGLCTPISILVLLVMYCLLVLPLRGRLRRDAIIYIFYALCFAMVTIWPFVFMDFSDILRRSFAAYIGKAAESFDNYECPGNESYSPQTFGQKLAHIGMHFMGGEYMQFNMQYTFYVAGLALGALLALTYMQKQQIKLLEDEIAQNLRYKHLKLRTHLMLALPVAYLAILTAPVMVHGMSQMKSGRRKKFFSFSDFMSVFFPNNCFTPEYAIPELASEILLFYFAFLIFECTTQAKGAVRAQRILYLRRFSTYSLTCFVFGYYLSPFLRTVLNMSRSYMAAKPLQWWQFLFYLLAYYVIALFVHLALDCIEGRFMPDWFLKVFAHLFSFGSKGKWKPITQNHLSIKQITLLSRYLE